MELPRTFIKNDKQKSRKARLNKNAYLGTFIKQSRDTNRGAAIIKFKVEGEGGGTFVFISQQKQQ